MQNAWPRRATHSARAMEVLSALPGDAERICLMGAGHLYNASLPAGLRHTASHELEAQLADLVAPREFFTGTERLTDVRLVGPWLWNITDDRQHLIFAIAAERWGVEQPTEIRTY